MFDLNEVVDLIQSNITIITGTIVAIAAATTAYISFRNRAIRIEILREHTKSLRKIAKEWNDQLPIIETPSKIVGYGIDVSIDLYVTKNKMSMVLPVQKRTLFVDLFDRHLPPELEIPAKWNRFRDSVDAVNEKRDEIRSYLSKKLQTLETIHLFEGPYMDELYHGITLAIHVPYGWVEYQSLNLTNDGPFLVLNGSNSFDAYDPSLASDFVLRVYDTIENDEHLASMVKTMVGLVCNCQNTRESLTSSLQDIPHYPILPGMCKYLRAPRFSKSLYRLSKWIERPTLFGHDILKFDSVKETKRSLEKWEEKER